MRTPERSLTPTLTSARRSPRFRDAMRVVIAKKLLSTVGGSEAQARALARALAKRHHDVTLVGLRPAWRRPGIPLDVYVAPPGLSSSDTRACASSSCRF